MSSTSQVSTPAGSSQALGLSLQSLFGKFLALAGLAYGVGFTVILTRTATMGAPVIEPFQAQTVIAGWPIWLLICVGVWLSPEWIRRIMAGRYALSSSIKQGLITTAISVGILIPGAIWAGERTSARQWPFAVILLSLSGVAFGLTITFVVQARNIKWKDPGVRPLFSLICFWFGFVFFVVLYALLVYPRLPQSYGGGRPEQVRIILKNREVASLISPQPPTTAIESGTEQVLLYYRTSAYLLVSRTENHTLIQIPADQVQAIIWLESQPR